MIEPMTCEMLISSLRIGICDTAFQATATFIKIGDDKGPRDVSLWMFDLVVWDDLWLQFF